MRDIRANIVDLDRYSKGALTKAKSRGLLCLLYMGDLFHQRKQWAGQLLQHNFNKARAILLQLVLKLLFHICCSLLDMRDPTHAKSYNASRVRDAKQR